MDGNGGGVGQWNTTSASSRAGRTLRLFKCMLTCAVTISMFSSTFITSYYDDDGKGTLPAVPVAGH